MRKLGTERLSNLSKVSQPVSGCAGIRTLQSDPGTHVLKHTLENSKSSILVELLLSSLLNYNVFLLVLSFERGKTRRERKIYKCKYIFKNILGRVSIKVDKSVFQILSDN